VSRYIFPILVLLCACRDNPIKTRNKINHLLISSSACDVCEAQSLIGETRDTIYVPLLLSNVHTRDSCVDHLEFKGMSIRSTSIGALKKIMLPGLKLSGDDVSDTLLIGYFQKRAFIKGWVRE
jgi:hypothetical protein